MKLRCIRNINHRLGNDNVYWVGYEHIGGEWTGRQFTQHEAERSIRRFTENMRHLPDPPKIGRIRMWLIAKLGG